MAKGRRAAMTRKELAADNDWRDQNPTESEWVASEETDHDAQRDHAELAAEIAAPLRLSQDMLRRWTAAELRSHVEALRADIRAIERAMLARLPAPPPRSAPPGVARIGNGLYAQTGDGKRKRR
jgi:hypothetical protein